MHLLQRIANQSHDKLTELVSSAEIAQAEEYGIKGWVVLRRTKMLKGRETYGQQTVYAQITDAGKRALEGPTA
jgi:hypothetical protein